MVFAKKVGEPAGVGGDFPEVARVEKSEEFGEVAEILGALAPLVKGGVGALIKRGVHSLAGAPVSTAEATVDVPFAVRKSPVADGCFEGRQGGAGIPKDGFGEELSTRLGAAGFEDMLDGGRFLMLKSAAVAFAERAEGVNEGGGVADRGEGPAGVTEGVVVDAEGLRAHGIAEEADHGTELFEVLADLMNGSILGVWRTRVKTGGGDRLVEFFAGSLSPLAWEMAAMLKWGRHNGCSGPIPTDRCPQTRYRRKARRRQVR
jgi:hypothetical protein